MEVRDNIVDKEKEFNKLYKFINKRGLENFISDEKLFELVQRKIIPSNKNSPERIEEHKLKDIDEQESTDLPVTDSDGPDKVNSNELVSENFNKDVLNEIINESESSGNSIENEIGESLNEDETGENLNENDSGENLNEEELSENPIELGILKELNEIDFSVFDEEDFIICQYIIGFETLYSHIFNKKIALDNSSKEDNDTILKKLNDKYLVAGNDGGASSSTAKRDIIDIMYHRNKIDKDILKKIIIIFLKKLNDKIELTSNFFVSLVEKDDVETMKTILRNLLYDESFIKELLLNGYKNKNSYSNEKYYKLLSNKLNRIEMGLNELSRNGDTPLIVACKRYSNSQRRRENTEIKKDMVKVLIEYEADANKCNNTGVTPLIFSIRNKINDIVECLVEHGADINKKDKNNDSPLHNALKYSNEPMLKYLIEHGADMDQKDNEGNPLLISVINKSSRESLVKWLIDKGINVNVVNKKGNTPLISACRLNEIKIVEYLLGTLTRDDNKVDINKENLEKDTPLIVACYENCDKIVELLVEHGADVNKVNCMGVSPLICSIEKRNENMAKYLIDNNADIEKPNNFKNTPLILAVKYNCENVVKYLIEKGVDIEKEDKAGSSPLFVSYETKRVAIMKILIKHGADINRKNGKGNTLLTSVCDPLSCGSLDSPNENLAKYLIDRGVDVNEVNAGGSTPLISACRVKNVKIVEYLLETLSRDKNRVDINKENPNMDGVTPLIMACNKQNDAIVELLLKHGADVHKTNSNGEPPLLLVHKKGDENLLKLLIRYGANVDQTDDDDNGNTLLIAAQKKKNESLVKFLIDYDADIFKENKYDYSFLNYIYKYQNKTVINHLKKHIAIPNTASNIDPFIGIPRATTSNLENSTASLYNSPFYDLLKKQHINKLKARLENRNTYEVLIGNYIEWKIKHIEPLKDPKRKLVGCSPLFLFGNDFRWRIKVERKNEETITFKINLIENCNTFVDMAFSTVTPSYFLMDELKAKAKFIQANDKIIEFDQNINFNSSENIPETIIVGIYIQHYKLDEQDRPLTKPLKKIEYHNNNLVDNKNLNIANSRYLIDRGVRTYSNYKFFIGDYIEWKIKKWNPKPGRLHCSAILKLCDYKWRFEIKESKNKYINFVSVYFRNMDLNRPVYANAVLSIRNSTIYTCQEIKPNEMLYYNECNKRFGIKYFIQNDLLKNSEDIVIGIYLCIYKKEE
ncbi:ankyrin [Piromyces finnis]|uniref:Ankyrin n=1 Tax=Piromyces finnis TaxID=1754191 RepID=A0A1Y1UVJ2_9FUNG|nr:ankyrin [Piromyces finnis]|eukprot:ORX41618.1 ankyrin [Piromyces finnis]